MHGFRGRSLYCDAEPGFPHCDAEPGFPHCDSGAGARTVMQGPEPDSRTAAQCRTAGL